MKFQSYNVVEDSSFIKRICFAEFMVGWCDSWSKGKLSRCGNYSCGMGGCPGWHIHKNGLCYVSFINGVTGKILINSNSATLWQEFQKGLLNCCFIIFMLQKVRELIVQCSATLFFIKDYQIVISNWLWKFEANLAGFWSESTIRLTSSEQQNWKCLELQ